MIILKKIIVGVLSLSFLSLANIASAEENIMAGITDTNGSNLNVRSKPSTSSSIVTKIKDNTMITIHSKTNGWYYIEYGKNQFGYSSSAYIDLVDATKGVVDTNNSNLNVRKGPSTSYAVSDKIYDDTEVLILGSSNNFYKILYNGSYIGYVSSDYISTTKYLAKTLNVPSYKQYDSRWANIYIGNSGQTFKQIGCTTTAMAMMESYRKNQTITPYQMYLNSNYTNYGLLYWPSNYQGYYDKSNYLEKLYQLINSGKPALLGMKTANNGQHWVVVTGYKANTNTLSAKNFTINDPGSSSRTTLDQFINSYPVFYKIMHY